MRKAILIFDMPMNCYECELNNYHFCDVTGDCIEEYRDTEYRPDFCPLRELPEKYNLEAAYKRKHDYDWTGEYEEGYNACIDELLGDGTDE